jgi:GDP-L-fucose synthase
MGKQPNDLMWVGTNVLVTGGAGFLGRWICARLSAMGANVEWPRSAKHDLRYREAANRIVGETRPKVVIHAAATCGGIGANQARPADFIRENLEMGINVLEACKTFAVSRVVTIGTVCEYPRDLKPPFQEKDLWDGYPEETNAPYGVAKRALLEMGKAYQKQYGMDVVHVLPANMYGPGDDFDPDTSHVIPALILKIQKAKDDGMPPKLWGSGLVTREFLHVDDGARGIILAAEKAQGLMPFNIGTGVETSIRELALRIADKIGYSGVFHWDSGKPEGQPRRRLEVSSAKYCLGFEAEIGLDDGLDKTIKWWRERA